MATISLRISPSAAWADVYKVSGNMPHPVCFFGVAAGQLWDFKYLFDLFARRGSNVLSASVPVTVQIASKITSQVAGLGQRFSTVNHLEPLWAFYTRVPD